LQGFHLRLTRYLRALYGLQEMSRRLLAEQNAEYEASLAADQEREARRQEEARRAQEVAQQQAAEEARQRCVGRDWPIVLILSLPAMI
jgi:hypothetical protein